MYFFLFVLFVTHVLCVRYHYKYSVKGAGCYGAGRRGSYASLIGLTLADF